MVSMACSISTCLSFLLTHQQPELFNKTARQRERILDSTPESGLGTFTAHFQNLQHSGPQNAY